MRRPTWFSFGRGVRASRRQSYAPHLESLESRDVPTTFTTLQLDEASQYLLEAVNRARANPAAEAARNGIDLNEGLAPGTISTAAKQPLAPNPALMAAIEGHLSVWMQSIPFWSVDGGAGAPNPHTGLGDGSPGDRILAAGYTGANYWGENLASRWQTNPIANLQAMADQLEQGLFVDSAVPGRGHRLNLLDPNYQEAGFAVASGLKPAGSFTGSNLVLLGQDFATNLSTAALGGGTAGGFVTGVVFEDTSGNGQYDIGEALSSPVQVTWRSGNLSGSTFVNDAGGYTTGKLAPGTWTITIDGGQLINPEILTVNVGTSNAEVDFTVPAANIGSPTIPPVLPPGFTYDANTGVLTVTAAASAIGNSFAFKQVGSTDTFTLNGVPLALSETLLSSVQVNLAGQHNSAILDTTAESAPQALRVGNGGGRVQHLDAAGNTTNFLTLTGFASVMANATPADQGFIDATPGVKNVFVGAGGYAYMNTGNQAEFFYYLKGAKYVYSYALSSLDYAYQYDGSGASAFTVSGTAYSLMLGTDASNAFFNEAVGFGFNEGIAQHPAQDVAYFYDSVGNDSFTGYTQYSSLTGTGENNIAAFFNAVYAYSFVGGTDTASVYNSSVNHVFGFRKA